MIKLFEMNGSIGMTSFIETTKSTKIDTNNSDDI
jgi:hypothetical protein